MGLNLTSDFQAIDYGNSTVNIDRLSRSVGSNTQFTPNITVFRIGTQEEDTQLPSINTTLSNQNKKVGYFSPENPIQRIHDIRTTQTPEEEFIFMRLSENPRGHEEALLNRTINPNGSPNDSFNTDTDLFAAFQDINSRNSDNVIQLPGREIPQFYNPATHSYTNGAPVYTLFDCPDSNTAKGQTRYFLDNGKEIKIKKTAQAPQLKRRTVSAEQRAEFERIKSSIENGTPLNP